MFINKEDLEKSIHESSSMSEAASKLGLHFSTFKRKAIEYNLYAPNQGGRGIFKPKEDGNGKIPLNEILNGLHPQYQSYKLKQRLYKENMKTNKCENCNIESWNGKILECELDHIDGDRTNHCLSNLQILCPNCHSQTDTFRFKRGKS